MQNNPVDLSSQNLQHHLHHPYHPNRPPLLLQLFASTILFRNPLPKRLQRNSLHQPRPKVARRPLNSP